MFGNFSLRFKLLSLGIAFSLIPLLIITALSFHQSKQLLGDAEQGIAKLAYDDLDHMVNNIYAMVEAQQDVLEQSVYHSLNVARKILTTAGGLRLSETDKIPWKAINQASKQEVGVELPKMMLGEVWIGQNKDSAVPTPIVDEVKELVGGTCTIFQRVNENGDMLRVATNVIGSDKSRAIGTFIPAQNPDGSRNAVVSSLTNGQKFLGRAYVVDAWYITAYEPIIDANKKIIGALYFGIKQESAKSLRKAIMDLKIGKTGYVYVVDSKGAYVISKDGKRDGENIWEAKDSSGNPFIQEIVKKALASKAGEIFEHVYPWKNSGEEIAKNKVVKLMYFKPWDWIIGVGTYAEEFFETRDKIAASGWQNLLTSLIITAITAILAAGLWFFIANSLSKKLAMITSRMQGGAKEVSAAAQQVSSSSQALAEGTSEQAASIEETSASLEEMASMTHQNANNAEQANQLMGETNAVVSKASEKMQELNVSMVNISQASSDTQKIVKTIDEIAFQTNLLALNAAVEAARAGEAGAGFAVVADEVRNLAMRAASAAKETSNLIEGTAKQVQKGSSAVSTTSEAFRQVAESSMKIRDLFAEITAASKEQSQGTDQISKAVSEMEKVVQQNAASAEESASASEEMNAQAEEMKHMADELAAIIQGGRTSEASKTSNRGTASGRSPLKQPGKLIASKDSRARKPEEVVPLDPADLRGF